MSQRDLKPACVTCGNRCPCSCPDVELVWHEEIDPRRLKRVAAILADILDNKNNPEEPAK